MKIAPFLVDHKKKYNFASKTSKAVKETTKREMDLANSDANAPDSWDSLDDPGPGEMSGEASDLSERLHSLNVNAKPFVPNVNAPAFVPSFMKSPAAEGKILRPLVVINVILLKISIAWPVYLKA